MSKIPIQSSLAIILKISKTTSLITLLRFFEDSIQVRVSIFTVYGLNYITNIEIYKYETNILNNLNSPDLDSIIFKYY